MSITKHQARLLCTFFQTKFNNDSAWNYHVGLTGSCLYGDDLSAKKDVDIIIYPKNGPEGREFDHEPQQILAFLGIENIELAGAGLTYFGDYGPVLNVWTGRFSAPDMPDTIKCDFFFLYC